MKKFDVNKVNISYSSDGYKYDISVCDYNFNFSRQKIGGNLDTYEAIIIKNNIAKIIKGSQKDLTTKEKNDLVNSMFEALKNNYMSCEMFNLDELKKLVESNYINIVLANDEIGFSVLDMASVRNSEVYKLDVILMDTRDIIGEVIINKDNLNINIDKSYLESSLKLLNNFVCLFRKEKILEMKK